MNSPADSATPPLAEPGKRPSGASVGGVSASAETGLAEGAQRSTERGDDPAVADRAATPTPATRDTTTQSQGVRAGNDDNDDEDEWRHPPVAPVDESNPLRSLGKAVADTLTHSESQTPPPLRER